MRSKKIVGVSLAALALSVVSAATFAVSAPKVQCQIASACKDQSNCKDNGVKMMSAKKCAKLHGTVVAPGSAAPATAPATAPAAPAAPATESKPAA